MQNEQPQVRPPVLSIWDELEAWSRHFADWQKLLLATAVRSGIVPQAVIDQAYQLLLAQHKLGVEPNPPITIPSTITGKQPAHPARIRLRRIHSPSGVNRLVHDAELTFGDGLTVVFGLNGVGKSGFARILSNACFSRQQHPIYPDVFDDHAPTAPSAVIEIEDENGSTTQVAFDGNTEHPALRRGFAVFDSAVADRHLVEGELGFSPIGFDVFSELARCYGAIQQMVQAEIQRRGRANTFPNAFLGSETSASKAAATLSANTDLEKLKSLAAFTEAESARATSLQTTVDQLRGNSPEAAIRELIQVRPLLLALQVQLAKASSELSEENLAADVRLTAAHARSARELARLGADQFNHDKLADIGSSAWSGMISAAVSFMSHQHEHYPQDGDICLLCNQPMSEPARCLFERYKEFSSGKERTAFESLERRLRDRRVALASLPLDLLPEDSVLRAYLARTQPAFLAILLDTLIRLESAKASVLAVFDGQIPASPMAIPALGARLDEVIAVVDRDINLLRQSDVPAAIALAEVERTELRHREVLSQNLDEMLRYVEDLRWIARAETVIRADLNTRPITDKEQELFSRVIADAYRNRLKDECGELDCAMPIEFTTQGRRGQTRRSLRVGRHLPAEILSEGEQRAVALADFLTEASLNEDNVGLIFDDPVSSLDHERKARIAGRLATEAQTRQVIVFTHDVMFFTNLCDAADAIGQSVVMHWMQRGPDNRPGLVSLNDGPTTTAQYRTPRLAEETLTGARLAAGSVQQSLIRSGAGKLRTTLEEIIPEVLFKKVVTRWTDRIMVTSLRKVNWDPAIVEEIVALYEECSAIMEGHSHTDASTVPPTPDRLDALIGRTKEVIRRAKTERSQ